RGRQLPIVSSVHTSDERGLVQTSGVRKYPEERYVGKRVRPRVGPRPYGANIATNIKTGPAIDRRQRCLDLGLTRKVCGRGEGSNTDSTDDTEGDTTHENPPPLSVEPSQARLVEL